MIVVVLSVTPDRLRGSLTRWLVEVSTGVYVGHLTTRFREHLWQRIVEDVGKGRALMVWSRQGEQRLDFRTHNHAWETVDVEGITLMRRQTVESREIRQRVEAARQNKSQSDRPGPMSTTAQKLGDESDAGPPTGRRNWSLAARRRRFRNAVEQRHAQDEGGG